MSNYIFNLSESEINQLKPSIRQKLNQGIYQEFIGQAQKFSFSRNLDNFVEEFCYDFCFIIRADHPFKPNNQPLFNTLNREWPGSLVSHKEDSGVFICKINVLNFLSITEVDFKDYLDGKKTLDQICKYFIKKDYKKFN